MSQEKGSSENAKSALADYLDDMLSTTVGGSPLPADEDESKANAASVDAKPHDSEKVAPSIDPKVEKEKPEESMAENKAVSRDLLAEPTVKSVAKKPPAKTKEAAAKPQAPKQTPASRREFAEPETTISKPKLAPPKISLAQPKLAPKVEAPAPELEEKVVDKLVEKEALATQTASVSETGVEQAAASETENKAIVRPAEWYQNGRPEWAQDRFEALLFSVAGLKLAVPLVSLGSIHRIEEEMTPLVGRADWFMGLYRTGDRNIQVVDTACWVMPRHYHEGVKEGYEFIIRLGDSNWGVACDSVAQAIQLAPDQVKWRTERSKRAWLAGTVIDHMCALLDAEMLNYLLEEDAKKRRV